MERTDEKDLLTAKVYGLLNHKETGGSKCTDDFTDFSEEEYLKTEEQMSTFFSVCSRKYMTQEINKSVFYRKFNEFFPYGSKRREMATAIFIFREISSIVEDVNMNPIAHSMTMLGKSIWEQMSEESRKEIDQQDWEKVGKAMK
jgi:hypothetical protein